MLGLARDSYLNLAELAREKESDSFGDEKKNLILDGQQPSAGNDVEVPIPEEEHDKQNSEEDPTLASSQDYDSSMNDVGETLQLEISPPQQPPAVEPQFRGFDYDYSDYENYNYNGYGGYDFVVGGEKRREQSLWCCLFPSWFAASQVIEVDSDNMQTPGEAVTQDDEAADNSNSQSQSRDEDDVRSVGSDALGEKLSDKDQKAVLARLRLAQPDARGVANTINAPAAGDDVDNDKVPSVDAPELTPKSKGLLNNIPPSSVTSQEEESGSSEASRRGILKTVSRPCVSEQGGNSDKKQEQTQKRRSLFPVYEKENKAKKRYNVQFANMARVITVRSTKEMSEKEKSSVWWQRSDYDDFKKTARLITKAILQSGSEVWLSTQPSNATSRKSTFEEANESASDKWWHRFGHSRRGLEHIASMEEGKERQQNCQLAINAVLEEQRRLAKMDRKDPERLRSIFIQYTAWAKDLALAAGASDADAVAKQFDAKRKSREFYLLKMTRGNPNTKKFSQIPSFMRPIYGLGSQSNGLVSHQLDPIHVSNAQISNKKSQLANKNGSKGNNENTKAASTSLEPLRDHLSNDQTEISIAKKAAGYSHEGAEKMNMSAVLSGMGGVVPTEGPAVGA